MRRLASTFRHMKAIIFAALSAIAVQPIVFCIWLFAPGIVRGNATIKVLGEIASASYLVLIVAAVFVFMLGIPIFLILRRLNKVNAISMNCSGFLVGAIPMLILAFPIDNPGSGFSYGGNWHGTYVQGMIDGVYTKYAWYIFIEKVIGFGMHGLIGAYIFLRVWQRYAKP